MRYEYILSGKYFDKKANTISNNVDDLHKLDIFYLFAFEGVSVLYNINNIRENKKYKN
jgi:hypothetical protein